MDAQSSIQLALMAQQHRDRDEDCPSEPIAIIGMSCRFPGAPSVAAYWELLSSGRDVRSEFPLNRWKVDDIFDDDPDATGKIYVRQGYFLEDVAGFDHQFFGIAPREASAMDPQQRLAMEVAFEAVEDAGLSVAELRRTTTGVFIGVGQDDYSVRQLRSNDLSEIDAYAGTGNLFCSVAGRVSYSLNLTGPSLIVDTACSSSLVALHAGCNSLQKGDCDLALVGGVHLILSPHMTVYLCRSKALARDGRCKAFDSRSDGFGRGEGAAIVVCKRLYDAVRDKDHIFAVVRSSAVNHDGRSGGYTVPNGTAQVALVRSALRTAGLRPRDIGYLEAHGTGTSLGDPIEVNALAEVFGPDGDPDNPRTTPLLLGSAKTNVGHLEAAAGMAGLLKVVLALRENALPGHPHLQEINPHIALGAIPACVPTALTTWSRGGQVRRAGVSSFGISGTNAHVILEEAPQAVVDRESQVEVDDGADYPLPISARSSEALAELINSYDRLLDDNREPFSIRELAYNAGVRRSQHSHRICVVGSARKEVQEKLQLARRNLPERAASDAPGVAFVYCGQGPQWHAMGRTLWDSEPVFLQTLNECDEALQTHGDWSLLAELRSDEAGSSLAQTEIAQPCLVALQIALTELWRAWGIIPEAVVGHSVGEVAAAYAAGVLTLSDAMRVAYHRGRLMQRATGQGGRMAAVEMRSEDLTPRIERFGERLCVATFNSLTSQVVAGEEAALQDLVAELESASVRTQFLPVNYAFHSPQMEPYLAEMAEAVRSLQPQPAEIPIYSTVTGGLADAHAYGPHYWAQNIRQPVRFATAIDQIIQDGVTNFVEIGPHPVLGKYVRQLLDERKVAGETLPSLRRQRPERATLLESLSALYCAGYEVDFQKLFDRPARHIDLPLYPWQRKTFWYQSSTSRAGSPRNTISPDESFLGSRLPLATQDIVFQSTFTPESPSWIGDHRLFDESIVVPGASHLAMAVAGALQAFGDAGCTLRSCRFSEAIYLEDDGAREVQLVISPRDGDAYGWSVHSRADESSDWTMHAEGRLMAELGSEQRKTDDVTLPVKHATLTGRQFYERFHSAGYQLGPRFRWIGEIDYADGIARGTLVAPQEIEDLDDSPIYPSLIDALFQFATMTMPEGGLFGHTLDGTLFVPFGVEELRFHGQPHGTLRCRARRTRTTNDSAGRLDIVTGDLIVFDAEDRCVLEITGWHLKRVNRESLLRGKQPRIDHLLHEIQWRQANPREHAEGHEQTEPGCYLVVHRSEGDVDLFPEFKSQSNKRQAVYVRPAKRFQQLADNRFELDLSSPDDLRQLLQSLSQEVPLAGVLYFDSIGSSARATNQPLSEVQAASLNLVHLLQAVARRSWRATPRIWCVTTGAHSIGLGEAVDPTSAALAGLVRVAQTELPSLRCTQIDLDPTNTEASFRLLTEDVLSDTPQLELAYRRGERFVPRLTSAIHIRSQRVLSSLIKPEGLYLITGGLGALGLATANWLAEQGARHLVLLSRSAPNGQALERIEALRSTGTEVHVVNADVSDMASLREALAKIDIHRLVGVIHAAGVLADGVLVNQTPETFVKPLAAKIAGCWNLHRLTEDVELDFFVLYSSAASVIGNPGQANYCVANSYLDAFAQFRRSQGLKATSISWGPWEQFGMAANQANRGDRLAQRGLYGIGAKAAFQALSEAIHSQRSHLVVAHVDWGRFLSDHPAATHGLLATPRPSTPVVEKGTRPLIETLENVSTEERQQLLDKLIRGEVASVLGATSRAVDDTRGFFELGMDSLMATELLSRLQKRLGVSLPSTLTFDAPNVEAMTRHLSGLFDGSPPTHGDTDDAIGETSDDVALEGLTGDELAELLLSEIRDDSAEMDR